MASKKYSWEERKKEFFENPSESLVDFISRKTSGKWVYTDKKWKRRLQRPFSDKTQWWVKERREYWDRILQDPEYFREKFMTEERRKKQAEVLDKAIDFWNNMIIGYMMRVQNKIKEWKGPYIDEVIKFGKMIQEYSGLKLLWEQDIQIQNEIKIDYNTLKQEFNKLFKNEWQNEENQ